jgi:predicted nucleic acid-binding protein
MNVVDSSGWLEYLAEGPNADFFAPAIENTAELTVPSISIYEVFKRVSQQRDEHTALKATALMIQGQVINLDVSLALSAAKISMAMSLPMAHSVIWATARAFAATLWTQNEHFKDIEGVRYVAKEK